jgi:hypothetical protein
MMIETYIPVNKMTVGNSYRQVFLVKSFDLKIGRNKKQYAKIVVSDTTGVMTGYCWDYMGKPIKTGEFFLMEVNVQQSKSTQPIQFVFRQDSVSAYKEIPLNLEDYILSPNLNIIKNNAQQLEVLIQDNVEGFYSAVLNNAINRGLMNDLKNAPYGSSGKLAIQGGLLTHTLRVVRGTLALSLAYKQNLPIHIDVSLAVAAAVLKNIGWSKYKIEANENASTLLTPEYATLMKINSIIDQATNDLVYLQKEDHELDIARLINSCCHEKIEAIKPLEGQFVFLADKAAYLANKKQ